MIPSILSVITFRAVFLFTNWTLFTYEKWIIGKSKMVHAVRQILTDFDDFGIVEKPYTTPKCVEN